MKTPQYIIISLVVILMASFAISTQAQSLPTITMDKPIQDMSISELQAKIAEILSVIQQLQALISQLQGGSVSCNFYRNLYLGISGSDVKCLQQYLNNAGHTVANSGPGSPNQETIYYGSLTRAAVKKWQDANHIEQGAWWGYFGPKSQAIYNELAAIPGEQSPYVPPEDGTSEDQAGTYCGDNIAQRPSDQMIIEDCDGTDLRNKICLTQGYTGGTLSCSNDCSFNTSQCTGTGPDVPTPPTPGPTTQCGDSIMQTPNTEGIYEVCDSTNLGTSTCLTYGYPGGTLSCSSDCITFNTTNCITALGGGGGGAPAPEPEPEPGPICGNNTDNICPQGCTNAQDTDCTYCGDNILQTPNDEGILEVCDTTKLNNQTCITKGYTGGTLQCSSNCLTFNTSTCTSPGPENQAPVLNTIGNKTINENSLLTFTISATDPDGDDLTYSIQNRPSGAEFNASTKTFAWTPLYDQSGTYQATFTVSDGSLTDTETITITVYNVNRAPILNFIGNKTIDENQQLSFTISGIDLDNDTLNYSIQNTPSGATFSSQTFTWTPTYEQSGTYTPTFIVSDAEYTDQETITITVNDVVTGPVCGDGTCEGTETCSTCSADCGECPSDFPTDYISWWKFDGDAIDSGPGGNDGTFVDNATTVYDSGRDYSADTNGYTLSLDGAGDYVAVANESNFDFGNYFTISAWINRAELGVYHNIFSKGVGQYEFMVNSSNQLYLEGTINSNRVRVSSGTSMTVSVNTWHHVVFVWNGAATNVDFYLNGEHVVGTCITACDETGSFDNTGIVPGIGGLRLRFNGKIDDVMIYDRVLNESEVQEIYNAQKYFCTGIARCFDYTDSNNCTSDPCSIGGGCQWDGTSCLRTEKNTWYVRPFEGSYGSENGTSYENAWDGLKSVVWGPAGVQAGDTLYVSGLHLFPYTAYSSSTTQVDITASGTSEDTRITIRGDYPGDQGIIWGGHIIGGDEVDQNWTDEGDNTYSVISPGTYNDWFYFEDVTATSYTLLTKVDSIEEVMNTPGSYYSPTFSYPDPLYVHTSDNGDPTDRIVSPGKGWNIDTMGQQYITFKDIEFYSSGTVVSGSYIRWEGVKLWYNSNMFILDNTHHIEFIDCDRAYGKNGFTIQDRKPRPDDAPHHITIRGCKIHDIGVYMQNGDAEGIGTNGVDDLIVENNEFYNVGTAFQSYPYVGSTNRNTIIRWNYIHDMHQLGGARGTGIAIGWSSANLADLSGTEIYGNIVANCPGVGYSSVLDTYEVVFYNNVAYNCGDSFYFNSIVRPDSGPKIKLKNVISINPTRYHIYFGSATTAPNYIIDSDYNLFYPDKEEGFEFKAFEDFTHGINFSEWQALSRTGSVFDLNSIVADPMFVSLDPQIPEDFKLQFASLAKDAGIDVGLTQDFEGNPIPQGSGPDIGAYESGASPARISQTDEKIDNVASIISSIQSIVQDIIEKMQSFFK